jgi:3-deoxy-D-manno-octulosonate 8-phosphate phosphatase (KDO 8-P phosphatase)
MIHSKLKAIKMLILDVDGVLTDGKIIIGNDGEELKFFNVKDGLGIKHIQKLGIVIAIITGKSSNIVQSRMSALGVEDIYQGQKNKLNAFSELLEKYNFKKHEVAYIGDDLPDAPLLNDVGCAIIPQDGHALLYDLVDYRCKAKGGEGAVREVCDLLYEANDLTKKLLEDYLALGEAGTYDI